MWHSSSSGRIELNITKDQAISCAHSGQCDDDVLALSKVPAVARQLEKIDYHVLSAELKEYGAWSDAELADHKQNIQRYLWCVCNAIAEGNF
jgi:hypothetical protein